VEPLNISCDDLKFDPSLDGDATDGKIGIAPTPEDYTSGKFPPGEYTVTICGETQASDDEDCAEFTIVLKDPCDPPTAVSVPNYAD